MSKRGRMIADIATLTIWTAAFVLGVISAATGSPALGIPIAVASAFMIGWAWKDRARTGFLGSKSKAA
jgi:hypothetical protein